MDNKLKYQIRTPTGLVIWNEFVWFIFSLPVKIDSWQDSGQHSFLEAVDATPSRVLADGTQLYGKPCILTVPVDNYVLIQSASFEPIRFVKE